MIETLTNVLNQAAAHFSSGKFDLSESLCMDVLAADPTNVDALHLLGLIAGSQGNISGIKYLEKALEYRANDVEILNNLGNLYKASGQFEKAIATYSKAKEITPAFLASYFNLAVAWGEHHDSKKAIEFYRQAILIEPNFFNAYFNLGIELKKEGLLKEATESYKQAILINPTYFEAYVNLAASLYELGQLDEAINYYKKALSINNQLNNQTAIVYNNLSVIETELGQYNQAKFSLTNAVALDPNFIEAFNNLGVVQRLLGEIKEAVSVFTLVIKKDPQFYQAWRNLGALLAENGNYTQAVEHLKKALEINPDFYEAYIDLGIAYAGLSMDKEANESFNKAQSLNKFSLMPKWASCMSKISIFYETKEDREKAYASYNKALDDLDACLDLSSDEKIKDAYASSFLLQPYYLLCHPVNNKEVQMKYGKLIQKITTANYPQWSSPLAKRKNKQIKVGIVSRHFNNHSDWKMFISGLLGELDRKQFQVISYATGGVVDDITKIAVKLSDLFVSGCGFEELAQKIRKDELDVLIYPELGQDLFALRLASLRLAPVQCAFWGVPQTIGLDTIDYFLTSDLMEAKEADSQYLEKLIRLPNLSVYYTPGSVEADVSKLSSYGVKSDAIRYLCVQSLYKYLPEHDFIYAKIASKIPNAQFLFVSRPEGIAERFLVRLKHTFAQFNLDINKHVTMLPHLSLPEFSGLLSMGHVFLDSIGFSGCVTTLEAIQTGLPIVTMSGQFMRGRQSEAMLSLMEIKDTIAKNTDEYVDIAIKLGQDEEFRAGIVAQTNKQNYVLYRDYEPIKALEKFLIEVRS